VKVLAAVDVLMACNTDTERDQSMSQHIRQLGATLVMMAQGCRNADIQSAVCGAVKYYITVIPYDKYLGAVFETSSLHFPTCCMLVIASGFSTDLE
jgi:hypothetical protein